LPRVAGAAGCVRTEEARRIFSIGRKLHGIYFVTLQPPLAGKINPTVTLVNDPLKTVCFRVNFESETRHKPNVYLSESALRQETRAFFPV
jgi:hypothetical protein